MGGKDALFVTSERGARRVIERGKGRWRMRQVPDGETGQKNGQDQKNEKKEKKRTKKKRTKEEKERTRKERKGKERKGKNKEKKHEPMVRGACSRFDATGLLVEGRTEDDDSIPSFR
jgi:hypothetical protein